MDLATKQQRAAFSALYKLHQQDNRLLLTDGILHLITDNEALRSSLNEDELAFYRESLKTFDYETRIAVEAQTESNEALIHAEQRAAELEQAKAEAERERTKAETLAKRIEIDRDELAQELEQTAMLQIQQDRMRWQFQTYGVNSPWAWGMMVLFLMGIFILIFMEKTGTEILIPILAGMIGTQYGAFAQSTSNLYTPMVKEETKRPRRTQRKTNRLNTDAK